MQLQDAIERFLEETGRHRSEVTARRYAEAMELLQSYLALELLDPDSSSSAAGTVADITPQLLGKFIGDFLGNRLRSKDRAQKRYVAATRSFVQWLVANKAIKAKLGDEILDAVREAARAASAAGAAGGEPDGAVGAASERYFQVLGVSDSQVLLLDLDSGREVKGTPPGDFDPEPGDIVSGDLERREGRVIATGLKRFEIDASLGDDDDDFDAFDEDSDVWDDDEPLLEEALEILAAEDRYAPREIVRVILEGFDDARDDLLEWLTDDAYRNEPFPAAGEAPANAARLLSERQDAEAFPRLLEVLGANDPVGEEAPLALARYGARGLADIAAVFHDGKASNARRVGAMWALAFVAVRNPALRPEIVQKLVESLPRQAAPVKPEILAALTEMRAVEALPRIADLAGTGDLDLEGVDWTLELFEGRVTQEGWGEAFQEAFFPVLYLYPTNEELEEFYESLEEDLGEFWSLMGVEEGADDDGFDDDDLGDLDDDDDDDPDDDPEERGKVIPFVRPK